MIKPNIYYKFMKSYDIMCNCLQDWEEENAKYEALESHSLYKPNLHSLSCLTVFSQSEPRIRSRSSASLRNRLRKVSMSGQNFGGGGGSGFDGGGDLPLRGLRAS